MPRRELEDRNIRKISKSGKGSHYVTIPVEFIRKLRWRERQKVVVEKRGENLLIKDWKPKK